MLQSLCKMTLTQKRFAFYSAYSACMNHSRHYIKGLPEIAPEIPKLLPELDRYSNIQLIIFIYLSGFIEIIILLGG